MTSVKTLKDLEQLPRNKDTADYNSALDDLKREAIKWVKELENKQQMFLEVGQLHQAEQVVYAMNILCDFFNLTEEEMK